MRVDACVRDTTVTPVRGIVAFEVDDEALWRRGLEAHGILAWTGDKRVRISP